MRSITLLFLGSTLLYATGFAEVLNGLKGDARGRDNLPNSVNAEDIRKYLEGAAYSDRVVSPADVEHYESLFARVAVQGELLPSDWRVMIQIAAKGWRFDKIREYKSLPLPGQLIKEGSLPTGLVDPLGDNYLLWRLDFPTGKLRKSREALDGRHNLLVIFHPSCGPCKRMAADISSDSALHLVMKTCSRWIGTVDASFSLKQFEDWDAKYPSFRSGFVRDWSSLGVKVTYSTPTLVLLRSGVQIDRVVGWARDSGLSQLKKLLQRNGIEKASDCIAAGHAQRDSIARA